MPSLDRRVESWRHSIARGNRPSLSFVCAIAAGDRAGCRDAPSRAVPATGEAVPPRVGVGRREIDPAAATSGRYRPDADLGSASGDVSVVGQWARALGRAYWLSESHGACRHFGAMYE